MRWWGMEILIRCKPRSNLEVSREIQSSGRLQARILAKTLQLAAAESLSSSQDCCRVCRMNDVASRYNDLESAFLSLEKLNLAAEPSS